MTGYSGPERRSGIDRRDLQRFFSKQLFTKGTREYARRAADRQRIIAFDRYPRPLMIVIISVLGLSLLDALLTLILIARGATELNPVMRYLLGHGTQMFLMVKYGLTAFSVMIIVIIKEPISARYRVSTEILHAFAAFFGGVVIWEFYLLSMS